MFTLKIVLDATPVFDFSFVALFRLQQLQYKRHESCSSKTSKNNNYPLINEVGF